MKYQSIIFQKVMIQDYLEGNAPILNYDFVIGLVRGVTDAETKYPCLTSENIEKVILNYGSCLVCTWVLSMEDLDSLMELVKQVNPKCVVSLKQLDENLEMNKDEQEELSNIVSTSITMVTNYQNNQIKSLWQKRFNQDGSLKVDEDKVLQLSRELGCFFFQIEMISGKIENIQKITINIHELRKWYMSDFKAQSDSKNVQQIVDNYLQLCHLLLQVEQIESTRKPLELNMVVFDKHMPLVKPSGAQSYIFPPKCPAKSFEQDSKNTDMI